MQGRVVVDQRPQGIRVGTVGRVAAHQVGGDGVVEVRLQLLALVVRQVDELLRALQGLHLLAGVHLHAGDVAVLRLGLGQALGRYVDRVVVAVGPLNRRVLLVAQVDRTVEPAARHVFDPAVLLEVHPHRVVDIHHVLDGLVHLVQGGDQQVFLVLDRGRKHAAGGSVGRECHCLKSSGQVRPCRACSSPAPGPRPRPRSRAGPHPACVVRFQPR